MYFVEIIFIFKMNKEREQNKLFNAVEEKKQQTFFQLELITYRLIFTHNKYLSNHLFLIQLNCDKINKILYFCLFFVTSEDND